MTDGAVVRTRDVLLVLMPDYLAPEMHTRQRLAPLGPAVVAACIAADDLRVRAVDLLMDQDALARSDDERDAFGSGRRVEAWLRGGDDPGLSALLERTIAHLDPARLRDADVIALSVDRGSQGGFALALSVELKRRFDAPVVMGGVATQVLRGHLERLGAQGPDVLTRASTPDEIRGVFELAFELPRGRKGPPLEPVDGPVRLARGRRAARSGAGWPMPDYSIYDLSRYRRDALAPELNVDSPYAGQLGASLVLPYHFAFECQFACAFCQNGGTQDHKPVDEVVRELATLAERWGTSEFAFFNAQVNLIAPALSRALIDARLDLRWSDSYRVRPSDPGDLELMARAGCASLTVGVESASDRVLKAMVKGHRGEHATALVRDASALEIMLRVNLLPCYPGERVEDFELTRAWIEEHAGLIDDIAPSSFYLTADSPVGRDPERFGLRIRGERGLVGANKFRKVLDALAYDEVDGMTWEEREPLLDASEDALREAWERGRPAMRNLPPFPPALMVALRRRFNRRAEAFAAMRRWLDPRAYAHESTG